MCGRWENQGGDEGGEEHLASMEGEGVGNHMSVAERATNQGLTGKGMRKSVCSMWSTRPGVEARLQNASLPTSTHLLNASSGRCLAPAMRPRQPALPQQQSKGVSLGGRERTVDAHHVASQLVGKKAAHLATAAVKGCLPCGGRGG